MFRLRRPEKQAGLRAGLGGFGWHTQRLEMRFVRFVWAWRKFGARLGAGLARVLAGLGVFGAIMEPVSCGPGGFLERVGCFWLRMGCAHLVGFGWFVQRIDMRFVWGPGASLVRAWLGFGAGLDGLGRVWCDHGARFVRARCMFGEGRVFLVVYGVFAQGIRFSQPPMVP